MEDKESIDRTTPTPAKYVEQPVIEPGVEFEEAANTPMTNEEVDSTERNVPMMPNLQIRFKVHRLYATIRFWQAQHRESLDDIDRLTERKNIVISALKQEIKNLKAERAPAWSCSLFGRKLEFFVTRKEEEF